MNVQELLLEAKTTILREESILFDNLTVKSNGYPFFAFKLYLVQDEKKHYIVCANSRYLFDDEITTFLGPYDRVPMPQSYDFHRIFKEEREAHLFFDDLLQNCPKKIDVLSFLPETAELYVFDERKSVHWTYRGKRERDDFFEKEFIRHGYERIMVRMFRFGREIILNKKLSIVLETEEESEQAFRCIKNHFSENVLCKLNSLTEEVADNKVLETFLSQVLMEGGKTEISLKRDFLHRITEFHVKFLCKKQSYSIRYELPTRNGFINGAEIKSSIYGTKKDYYAECRYRSDFLREIQSIFQ